MKNTKQTIKNLLSELTLACTSYTKEQREEFFKTFKSETLCELSKGNNLATKESNILTSAYATKIAFIESLKDDKKESYDYLEEEEKEVLNKVIAFASKQVSNELKIADNSIYSTYDYLKLNDLTTFNEYMKNLIGMPITKELFNFLRAYMFTTEKALSKKAYVKKFIDLFIALKKAQGTYSLKFEKVTLKHIFSDIVVTDFDVKSYTYEDLKAFVMDTQYRSELVNDDMVKDTKVLRKALKNALVLTSEEMEIYFEIFG